MKKNIMTKNTQYMTKNTHNMMNIKNMMKNIQNLMVITREIVIHKLTIKTIILHHTQDIQLMDTMIKSMIIIQKQNMNMSHML